MNLRDLSYLVAVADLRNFSQAAEQCSIGQPTLSTQIKKLEDYLGVDLFVREKNSVEVTDTCQEILPIARRVLVDIQTIRQIAAHAGDRHRNQLSIGAFPSLASYVLPEYVFRIKQHFPELKLQLVEEKTDSLIRLLLDKKLDAALLALPVEHETLEYRTLFDDPFTLAVCDDHPLAQQEEVDLNRVAKENLLLLDEGHCLRDQTLKLCDPSRFVEHDFRASSLETLRFMVKNGVGVTLMPSVAIQPDDKDIRYINIRQRPSRTIALVWQQNHPRSLILETLAKLLAYKPLP
ncbi:MAG: LysR substrate-binding domain-containing protein [Methylicorpusculum sp.]|uniref:LysR substrate-binding domain-containing protein n=1 Tax=Methylicorpusculum sp. TaxID=2713644 RepID=UPI002720FE4D|nr:LysR substrate-binding domain-containing protein [Methylicorpusculum sp.]MDO8939761.1 LysR substrate-binding domain-containing protein [Methylicorpusculum sp.]MDP2201885.1 LysR substrate-binding domain-containing protein [Methylicorpusculum sp.]